MCYTTAVVVIMLGFMTLEPGMSEIVSKQGADNFGDFSNERAQMEGARPNFVYHMAYPLKREIFRMIR